MSSKSKSEEAFKKGDKVQARWSGSNSFFNAKVLDVYSKSYKVQFEDGSVSSVKLTDVKKSLKSESPKITAKPRSRSRSAGRKTRSRSRSPARERKATATKSEKKTPSKVEKKKSEGSPNTNSVSKDETDRAVKVGLTREKIGSQNDDSKASSTSSVVTTNSYTTKELQISLQKHEDSKPYSRPSRLSSLRSPEPVPSVSDSRSVIAKTNAVSKDASKYSDDESDEEPKVHKKAVISTSWQIFSFLTVFCRIILMPTVLLFLIYACTRKQCTVLEVPQFYSRWKDLGNNIKIPFPSVILFHMAICLVSLIPLGKKVTGFQTEPNKTAQEYRLNGFLCLIFALLSFGACSYFGVYMNWGFDKFKSIGLSALIYAVLCSLLIHIVSSVKGNATKLSEVPLLGNFYSGTYMNPFLFGKVDVKTTFIRAALVGSMVMDLSILFKFFLMKGYLTIPLGLCSGMQMFFVFDMFVREEKMLSTAIYTSDCVGYAFIMTICFLIPMGLVLPNVYLFIYDTKASLMPHWCSAAIVGLFMCGYYIYMSSSNMKHNFRRNPFSSSFSGIDSIPTSKKKRLIASGLWGIMRHPNYLGILIMCLAWTLPCSFSHLVPYGPLIMLTIAIIVRCFKIEAECKEKYGPAWNNYTQKVRSRLIPYIF